MRRTLITTLLMMGALAVPAERLRLTLDDCRALALENNKALRIANIRQDIATEQRKSAYTNFLPKANAAAAYMRTEKEVSIVSDAQAGALSSLGLDLGSALRTDTRNLSAAALLLTQPIYAGGKIHAYYNITRYAEQLAADREEQTRQEVLVEVDETYWKIIHLQGRRALAEGYLGLVETLDHDVQEMISEGMATKADGLSVKVKVNEAKVALIQVDNGVSLLKLKLCQLCGIEDRQEDIDLSTQGLNVPPTVGIDSARLVETAMQNRPELAALQVATKMQDEKVRIARAEYLPTVALTGGYTATNPSVFDGFQKKMKGMWNVGVGVSMPLSLWGDRQHKTRAAKRQAQVARVELDEAKEKIELQVRQCRNNLQEATKTLDVTTRSMDEANENLQCATYGYKEGVLPLSNVIEAQTAWLSAHAAHISAQVEVRVAETYLKKSIGILK